MHKDGTMGHTMLLIKWVACPKSFGVPIIVLVISATALLVIKMKIFDKHIIMVNR